MTGISKGIGKAICEMLVSEGYFVHGTYNTGEKEAGGLKEKLKNVEIYQVDFTNRQKLLELVEKLKKYQLDVIVNNAGVIHFELFDTLTIDSWDDTLSVNLTAPLLICHGLRKNINRGGSIINISSTDGSSGCYASIAYSVSKAGLINLTKSLGNIFGPINIRVNSVSPSWVGAGMDSPAVKEAVDNTPLGKIATFDEIAKVVSFLVSEKASYINGTDITVDGGYSNVDPILKKEAEELEKK